MLRLLSNSTNISKTIVAKSSLNNWNISSQSKILSEQSSSIHLNQVIKSLFIGCCFLFN